MENPGLMHIFAINCLSINNEFEQRERQEISRKSYRTVETRYGGWQGWTFWVHSGEGG